MEKSIKQRMGLRRPAKASIWYMGASSLTKAVGVLTTPIFTRLLSDVEYGQFALYMSWLGFASVICSTVSSASTIYKGLQKYSDGRQDFLSSTLGVSLCFCASICLLLFTFSRFLGLNSDLIFIMSLQLICDTVVSVSLMYGRYSYDYIRVSLTGIVQSLLSPLIAVILIEGAELGYYGRIYGLLIASLAIASPALITVIRGGGKFYDRELWGYIGKRSLPLLPHSVSGAISAQADKLIITATLGTAALARYSVAHSLGIGLTITISAMGSALNPWIVRKLSAKDTEVIAKVFGCAIFILGAAVLFLIGGAPEAMLILAPEEYSEALPAVMPIALSTLPAFVISIGTVGIIFCERNGYISASAAAVSVTGAVANLVLIPFLGYFGAGMALLLSQTVGAVITILLLSRLGIGDMLSMRKFLTAFLFSAIWGLAISTAGEHPMLRAVMLIPPIVILAVQAFKAKDFILERS